MAYDFIIVGGGVAGIATAELLQRSGQAVLLLEKNHELCSESSAEQQGWFHTGALYAALPNKSYVRACERNLEILRRYYTGFPAMNLDPSPHADQASPDKPWFNESFVLYIYSSIWNSSVPFHLKPAWWWLASQARSFTGWRGVTRVPSALRLGKVAFCHRSADRTMNTDSILSDLVASFIASGGELRLHSPVSRVEHSHVATPEGSYTGTHIIVTSSKNIDSLCGISTTVLKSPLLVLARTLSEENFVIMHPIPRHTMNHIVHTAPQGQPYSVLGNALYFAASEPTNDEAIHARMIALAEDTFGTRVEPEEAKLFFGFKTEMPSRTGLRSYQPTLMDTGSSLIALPGKFSLSFTMAVDICLRYGIVPRLEVAPLPTALPAVPICSTHHRRCMEMMAHSGTSMAKKMT